MRTEYRVFRTNRVCGFDSWGRHPAAFSFPQLATACDAVSIRPGELLCDPFCGSGRAATFAVARGDAFIGIEAHPLMSELGSVKLSRPADPEDLIPTAIELTRTAGAQLKIEGRGVAILDRFIHTASLHRLIQLRSAVREEDSVWAGHLRWALLSTLRKASGGGWPYPRPRRVATELDVDAEFLQVVATMAEDLTVAPRRPRGRIISGDARSTRAWETVAPESVAGCVSSPPYLNQISYAEATRIEMHFLQGIDSWGQLVNETCRALVASSTQQVTGGRDVRAWGQLAKLPATCAAVASLVRRLQRAQEPRRRPKRYDRLLPCYFADVAAVLCRLHRAMAPDARAAWVVGDSAPYGVWVDTPSLLGLVAEEVGFEVLDDVHLRERGRKWPSAGGVRHGRVLSERLLIFRRRPPALQLSLFGSAT